MADGSFNVKSVVWTAMGGLITLLIATNAFFIKGLVDKIGHINNIESEIAIIQTKLEFLVNEAKK